jgi:uncharacterized RDD family membrane protein YckC
MAMIYEVLPLFAVAFMTTLPLVGLMPQNHVPSGNWWYRVLLVLVLGIYLTWGWVKGGQSLGMRPWRLWVVSTDGRPLTWGRAWLRYLVAILGWLPFGAGHWWPVLETHGRSWHDLAAGTRVVYRPQ